MCQECNSTVSPDNLIAMNEGEIAEEGIKTKGITAPYVPTKEEVEEHERSHIPFRAWCKHCVFGKGENTAHRSTEATERGVPQLDWDYMYMKEKTTTKYRPAEVEGEGNPIVVCWDHNVKAVSYTHLTLPTICSV